MYIIYTHFTRLTPVRQRIKHHLAVSSMWFLSVLNQQNCWQKKQRTTWLWFSWDLIIHVWPLEELFSSLSLTPLFIVSCFLTENTQIASTRKGSWPWFFIFIFHYQFLWGQCADWFVNYEFHQYCITGNRSVPQPEENVPWIMSEAWTCNPWATTRDWCLYEQLSLWSAHEELQRRTKARRQFLDVDANTFSSSTVHLLFIKNRCQRI